MKLDSTKGTLIKHDEYQVIHLTLATRLDNRVAYERVRRLTGIRAMQDIPDLMHVVDHYV